MQKIIYTLLLFFPAFLQSQSLSKKINDYTNSYVNTGDFSGCILITKQGEVIFQNCYGKANAAFQIENTSSTKFMIGSISKQITATAILRLEEQGKLSTKQNITPFFPELEKAQFITIEQLLTHQSGITDIYNVQDFKLMNVSKKTVQDLAQQLLKKELDFQPGTNYQYSNGGYAVLGAIIEKASGMAYGAYLKQYIFDP
ncbi:MAG: serine hydrolase domain-containing protein, partial [Bacteroidota bacterium]